MRNDLITLIPSRQIVATVLLCALIWCDPFAAHGQDRFTPRTGGPDEVVELINQHIRQAWEDNDVEPSALASDSEWVRRVHLDIVGSIPSVDVVESFLADRDKSKRAKLIETLLDDPGYTRNWTTIWTNLCIGRQTPRRTSRTGMEKFFREAFGRNRPWNDVVFDLISAEGHFEEEGAVNFLLSQMTNRDDAIQATAKATRLFMGIQIQCTQCHDHPFVTAWKQSQFWEFNSFFRQTRRIDHRSFDAASGRRVDDFSELVGTNFSGPVYYENRAGEMNVAYPSFFGVDVDPERSTERRTELARLMTTVQPDQPPYLARAMVNRIWGHFFGFGFTNPVDDMGEHNEVSHPELLDLLAQEFIDNGYSMQQLMRWICNSEAYQLTSSFAKNNRYDDPASGNPPLFSRMYVKLMEAEQLYDSLLVATSADKTGTANWERAQRQRDRWLQQFVVAFGTDENDEATTFNGTIPQSLMMMNGELTQNAIQAAQGGYLYSVLSSRDSDNTKIRRLFLSTLSRIPTRAEMSKASRMIRESRNKLEAYQDLFWALLNCNEFIVVH